MAAPIRVRGIPGPKIRSWGARPATHRFHGERSPARGNIYRHVYEDVAANMVWESVRLALPPLCAAIVAEIEQAAESPGDGS
jgi:hypothetical protein